MKRLVFVAAIIWSVGCASAPITQNTVKHDAQVVIQALNAASQLSVQGLNLARSIQTLPPDRLVAIQDGMRAFNCALLDDGNPAPMPAGGTVTDSCHSHHAPMLGLISKLGTVASSDTLEALKALGLSIADAAIQTLTQSGNDVLRQAGAVALGALTVLR